MAASSNRDDSFDVESNSPFYFNTSHWRAVDGMLEGVKDRAGLMILTGPTGSGKTMIMRAISEGLEENTPGLFLQYASLNFREFVNFLHSSLKVEDEVMDAPNKAVALREFLYIQAKRDETGVVFIDEAHNLEPDVLKMLPKLARFDTLEDGRVVGLQFILIGSDDLRDTLRDPEFEEVRGKVRVDNELRFFTRGELKQFLNKRLAPIARMTDEPITEDGIEAMGKYTGGSPRLIGMICSHTMLFAAENPGQSIDETMVKEAAEALMLKEVDNPFADEDNDPQAASGPFSEADMTGESVPPVAKPSAPDATFSDTQTVYPDMDDEDGERITGWAKDIESDEADAVPDKTMDMDLYADDHSEASAKPIAPLSKMSEDEQEAFDHAAFDRALDASDDDFYDEDYDDDEFGDLDDDEDDEAAKSKKTIKKGGTSFLTRLGWGGGKTAAVPKKIKGASRKRERAEPIPTAQKRKTKTTVKGERERKLKMAGIAAGVVAVMGAGYAVHKPVIGMVAGLKDSVMGVGEQFASAPTPPAQPQFDSLPVPTVQTVASGGADQIEGQAQPAQPVTVTVDNAQRGSTASGGWGAKVVVERASEDSSFTIPAPATNIAKGALDLVDRALNVGERNSADGVKGVLAAASDQVAGLRNKLANNGLTDEEKAAKVLSYVEAGDKHLADKRYITPAGDSAYDSYREALQLQPDNDKAKEGIRVLREYFAQKAEGARNARQWETANTYFETAIAISNLRPVK